MINSKKYFVGVAWFIASMFMSVILDIAAKYLDMNSRLITFYRFFFSTITLLPYLIFYDSKALKTERLFLHFIRGGLLCFAINLWIFGLKLSQIAVATMVSFTIPLFVLILGIIFLNERVRWQRFFATFVGFIGIIIICGGFNLDAFNKNAIFLVFSAIIFATLDVINKKFISREPLFGMVFYSALFTTLLSIIPAMEYFRLPNLLEFLIFSIVGIFSNLILVFILKAFEHLDATAIAPYRYFEIIISMLAGFIIFDEYPNYNFFIGGAIIIPATLFIAYSETLNKND